METIETIQVLGDNVLLQEVIDPQNQAVLSEIASSLISEDQKRQIEQEKRMENLNPTKWIVISAGPETKERFMIGDIVYAYMRQEHMTAMFVRNKIEYFEFPERYLVAREVKLVEDKSILN